MRLLIVSNRLSITVAQKDGKYHFKASAGGLATGLSAFIDSITKSDSEAFTKAVWIGWPGLTVENAPDQAALREKLYSEYSAYPVFLSKEDMEKFYYGFCNKTLWALFHYFPTFTVYDNEYWKNYNDVNRTFCNVILEMLEPGDVLWIHDYHLMLLPRMIREQRPDIKIGFFLHIPFPSFEVFRLLPRRWRSEILTGLLGADLIGFHTHDYAQYFLRCVLRVLGIEHSMGEILYKDRLVKAETFPMGIDFQKFHQAAKSDEVRREKQVLADAFRTKVILSIDRLDYTKGIVNRLRSYEAFLKRNPEWHEKVIMIMVVIPSRTEVEQYQLMKKQIDELVGRINGRFARIRWTPIIYQYKSLSFQSLVTLYSLSDVILVTPLRDGMNLIAKEYVACRTDDTGVLILSEMAGASQELGEAVVINPNSIEEIVDALSEALTMPVEEQAKRNQSMQNRLKRYDIMRWASDFLNSLLGFKEVQRTFESRLLGAETKQKLLNSARESRHRILFLDYDGTLVPFAGRPHQAIPDEQLLSLLQRLSADPKNDVVLISGRDKQTLQDWFGSFNIGLISEHGVWAKEKSHPWRTLKALNNDWKSQVRQIFEIYCDRLPGAFVEEKDFSLAFHYREADLELSSRRVKELTDHLVHFTANIDVHVLQGSKVVEMRNSGVDKGSAARWFLGRKQYDFIFAVGDDWTDEDLFRALPPDACSIKVGLSTSHAKYRLRNHEEVRALLQDLTGMPEPINASNIH